MFASPLPTDRRRFLMQAGQGFGMLALADLLGAPQPASSTASAAVHDDRSLHPLAPRAPQFAAKAKSVIWLFMNGGQSQVDTWDYKPELAKRDGQTLEGFDKNTGFFAGSVGGLMKSPFAFKQHGKSGTWASDLFPQLSQHVDDMAFIHSCFTQTNNHSPALFQINTGMSRMGFPCVGSWTTYGLGSESKNLPAFVVMYDTLGRGLPKGYASNWSAGFLPGVYQGTALNAQGAPIDNMNRSAHMSDADQRRQLDLLARLNAKHLAANPGEQELAARIESFELAYRMQTAAPEAFDLTQEPENIRKLYGLDEKKSSHFAKQALTARRLVERGVRFVQIYSGGMDNQLSWDGHNDIEGNHRGFAQETDQPIAALIADLKNRGLLESTLIVCCGEFGRLPIAQKSAKPGRDHNPHAFTAWFAGGGAKGGVHYGETDEIGFKSAVDRVSVNDLHATILAMLGLEHTKLTYRLNGRDFRLTDVAGNVVKEIIA
ncbi:MAG: DUF1501 domain-containing protein [Planctomycetia bacterium]|nr:DUF1501 domain-containing protein [Planctomycetia bacterium]